MCALLLTGIGCRHRCSIGRSNEELARIEPRKCEFECCAAEAEPVDLAPSGQQAFCRIR